VIATAYSGFWYAFLPLLVCIHTPFGLYRIESGAFSGAFVVGRFFRVQMHDPPSPLCCCVGIRCLGARFCAESDRVGAVFGLLPLLGECFRLRCMTPPL